MKRLVSLLPALLLAAPALGQAPGSLADSLAGPLTGSLTSSLAGSAHGATETIGPWLVSCSLDRMTDEARCRMLHSTPVAPASAGLAPLTLEVEQRDGALVPVVAARDLSLDGAGRGLLALAGTVQLRFPPERLFDMPCALEGRSVVCAPRASDRARAAAELPGADRVLLRVTGFLLPEGQAMQEPVELRLPDTAAALARLRARLPQGATSRPETPAFPDLREILSRILGLLGVASDGGR